MTPAEMSIVCLVYAAALLLGQRLAAMVLSESHEAGFVVAAVAAALLASAAGAVMTLRRLGPRRRILPPALLTAGAAMAGLTLILGMISQMLWQLMARPLLALIAGAGLALLVPFAVFPLMRAALRDRTTALADANGVGATQVLITAAAALLIAGAAFLMPGAAGASLTLAPRDLSGLTVALPADWSVAEENVAFEIGTLKHAQPNADAKYVSVRWAESGPVQADDFVKVVTGGAAWNARDRSPALAGGHEGTTFFLESPNRDERAAVTLWHCPQDHRVLWIVTNLAAPEPSLRATHRRLVESIHCHTSDASTSRPSAEKVFPTFVAPPGFTRQSTSTAPLFLGSKGESILFLPAIAGRSQLTGADLAPAAAAEMFKGIGLLQSLDGQPVLTTAGDLSGHQRRVWSVSGKAPDGSTLQVEVVAWYCNARKMTFMACYATPSRHDANEARGRLPGCPPRLLAGPQPAQRLPRPRR
ncbi:MAG: hypothetical protein ABIP55_12410 [Tepidisphaeraceae bacterium]